MSRVYTVLRSSRKTLAIQITDGGDVVVRAPAGLSTKKIDAFVQSREDWIARHVAESLSRPYPAPSDDLGEFYRNKAKAYLPERVAYYSQRMQLVPTAVTITSAKTRYGSCSGSNRLCFSWRLMAYPTAFIDYVVVHELAHIVHKNHGPAFYALIEDILPDWRARRDLLRPSP